jgi:hypothetical protein
VSGSDFAISVKRLHSQNVAAGFSLRLHRLEACATKNFPDEKEIPDVKRFHVQTSMAGSARPKKNLESCILHESAL